ncbi:EAL domain-containing protein [Rhodocyclus tenuis]|uniref:Diguanylate cyclase (GGDEF)-like protein/PAS domain S-box-containing protein n=1 Tax=Rhodocyclus tenuis TaxID=1066 RepID=A0A840GBT9_RHOTE|nr:EAL domain-containing protein [Rhodocyclus tenuis]MBB4245729.1 diguanylate cyclase (GGDEF)-like protein/PAS domain S-box-containing protein [Rhodocyclus tenuis]
MMRRPLAGLAPLLGIFALLALGIGLVDYDAFRSQQREIEFQAEKQLATIADLKVRQISQWRDERLADAQLIRDNPLVGEAIARWIAGRQSDEKHAEIKGWLNSYVRHFDFREALLLAPDGRILAATADALPVFTDTIAHLQEAERRGAPLMGDLQPSMGMESYLDLVIPLNGRASTKTIACLVFRIDPQRFLFPLMRTWPTPSESAETLLVERRDRDFIYLNELRGKPGMTLRAVGNDDLAARPSLADEDGAAKASIDYRGASVFAATRPVPGSRWLLIAKIDQAEVLSPLDRQISFIGSLSALLLLGAGAMAIWLWHIQRRSLHKQRSAEQNAAREIGKSNEHLLAAQRIAGIGSWERPLPGEAMWWSAETARLLGYPPDTEASLDIYCARVHPDDREVLRSSLNATKACGEQPRLAFRLLLPSGEVRHCENVCRVIADENGLPTALIGATQDISERRRTAGQLAAVLQQLPQGISVFDEHLQLQHWNAGLAEILDLPPDQLFVGARFADLIRAPAERGEYGPGDPDVHVQQRLALALRFEAHRFERTRPNGRTYLIEGAPYQVEGQLAGFITTYTEISERKNAELQLERQHAILRTIIDNIPGGVSLMDAGLNIVACNREFRRLLDFPDTLFDGRGIVSLAELARFNALRGEYGPGDPEQLAAAVVERARSAEAHRFERRRPQGTTIEVRGTPLPDGGFVTIYTDVSERKLAEERLLLAEKVFDNSPDAIVICNAEGAILSTNQAFTQITGYSGAEVIGRSPRSLGAGAADEDFHRRLEESLNERGRWAGEVWDRRKDGEAYPAWMTVNAVIDRDSGRRTHLVGIFSDISERKQAEERIHYLAHHDALTGLPNRLSLEARLEQSCSESRRRHSHVGVLFIDLDRFKVINDTLGHHIGDLLLIEVSRRLSGAVRESDIVARLGGDEFIIVLPGLNSPDDAASVALKIVAALNEPVLAGSHELHTSPSIGISVCPDDGEEPEQILRNADTAMYHAKALGRNNFQFYAEEMNRNAHETLELERRLRQALTRAEFSLDYQPVLNTSSRQVVGVEALLRWRPDGGEAVPPARFIPIAEETGLIVALGNWVLRTATRQLREWIDAGLPPVRVAVNVSAHQLRRSDFSEQVAAALADSGLPATLLELEITESAVMKEPEAARVILERLRSMGVRLAIDDFGTGYSSLAYLKRFPIDHLKIDRSFVTDIEHDANDAAIAVSTIALAHSLGIGVVAEGVESEAQFALLAVHDCDEVQGYLFSRPLPAEAALAFLRAAARGSTTGETTAG